MLRLHCSMRRMLWQQAVYGTSIRSPSQSFRADIDYGRIRDRESTRVDRVRTVCPNGFTKLCKGNTWRWIDSGEYLSDGEGFNKWNQR